MTRPNPMSWTVALASAALLWSVPSEAQTAPLPTVKVTTALVAGAAGDAVVASVVDAGVRTGGHVTATVRILSARGVVLAQQTGVVSEGNPLRITVQAADVRGMRAQVLLPPSSERLSAAVLVIERGGPLSLSARPVVCPVPTIDPGTGMPDPTNYTSGQTDDCTVTTQP